MLGIRLTLRLSKETLNSLKNLARAPFQKNDTPDENRGSLRDLAWEKKSNPQEIGRESTRRKSVLSQMTKFFENGRQEQDKGGKGAELPGT